MLDDKKLGNLAGKSGIWYTVGNIVLKGALFFSLPVFTRILSTADFGEYNTYIAYEQIIVSIIGFGIYGSVKNARIDFERDFESYISSALSLCFSFFAIIVVCINVYINLSGTFLGYGSLVANCLLFQSFGSALLNIYSIKLNTQFKYKSFLVYASINTLGNILVSIILILWIFPNERYLGRILGSAIPLILIGVVIFVQCLIKGKTLFHRVYWKYALLLGLPLIPHVLSQSLLNQFDRIMITRQVGASESGVYSSIYTISTILYVVETSFEHAWSPWVFLQLKDGKEKQVKQSSRQYVDVFFLLTIGFMCVMPEISKIFCSSSYWEGIPLIFPLSASMFCIFMYSMPANIEYYNKKPWLISVGTVMAAGINIVLNYIFINLYGYEAAAYTTAFSYLLLFAFHWIFSIKYDVGEIYDLKTMLKYLGGVFATMLVFQTTYNLLFVGILIRYICCAIIIFKLIGYKDRFIQLIFEKRK